MTERIIIEGNTVRHVRETLISEVPLATLEPHLITFLPTFFPTLPTTPLRAVAYDPTVNRGIMMVEKTPAIRPLNVFHYGGSYPDDEARAGSNAHGQFNVLFPWTYFLFGFTARMRNQRLTSFSVSAVQLLWGKERYKDADSPLWLAQVPNVDRSGYICWGYALTPQDTLANHVDNMVNAFFESPFNQDLGHLTPFDHSLTEWERHSTDIADFLNWNFWTDNSSQSAQHYFNEHLTSNDIHVPNPAEATNSLVALPELPAMFTLQRAREWVDSLTDGQRTRLAMAMVADANVEATV